MSPTQTTTPVMLGPTLAPTASRTFTPTTATAPSADVSPTRTPTAADFPIPEAANAYVRAEPGFLRLRDGPGTVYDVVLELDDGEALKAIARAGEGNQVWLKVIAPARDDAEGWVLAAYVRAEVAIDALPDTGEVVVNATPAPAGGEAVASGQVWGVTANARAIYLRGLALGNRGSVFSKVGDSITATWVYLYPIGSGNYHLGNYGYLQGVINFFSSTPARATLNSFANFSLAAWGGWTTRDVLSPDKNQVPEAGVCEAGETPLACEYRVSKPAVAIIMLGTNDSGGIPDAEYEANMRRIIDITIDHGVIPVLSTIPPRPLDDTRVAGYNAILRGLARYYDIPLMDYWQALSDLPNVGISDDLVHPSVPPGGDVESAHFSEENLQYGATVRNLLTLQVLDALWRTVLYDYDSTAPPPLPAGAVIDLAPEGEATQPQAVMETRDQPAPPVVPAAATPLPPAATEASAVCASAPPARLSAGVSGVALITVNMRRDAGPDAAHVADLHVGESFTVLAGPVCNAGLRWWQVESLGRTGWVASGSGSDYWLEPR